ncbi:hypothetical protein DDZ14_13025 [Maritimibacter sp. 55A14]|uniref:response regulator n=1 Tax=Maritimibacter sp. 55A14 TaxID=2174844 RepID=UPI000D60D278|nr:response regulator [Maritimibacter sp. 55A14]PWE31447.1 hypothetical protein DDZ14_13025 [Maritimibacter sp. 55A14]
MTELKKILHVEDERDIREIARMSLAVVGGFDLEQCGSGDEALERVRDFGPDLILMDVMMPGMDGETAMDHIRALDGFGRTPVVFMTAKASNANVDLLREKGAADVITKPFDPIALPEQLREIWRGLAGAAVQV